MWTLGFDSTASTVTPALLRDGKLFSAYSADSTTTHSTTLLPAIERLLASAGIAARDLELICCSAGPGSFTGVRIGVATAKGLASPFGTPCVGVSSLEAMAYMYSELHAVICPVLGARRGNVYAAVFLSDGKGNVTRLCDDDLVAISDMEGFIAGAVDGASDLPTSLYFCGDSIKECSEAICEGFSLQLCPTPAMLASPSGYGAAACGLVKYNSADDKSGFTDAALLPIYLRKSQAEREKEEKQSGVKF